MATTKNDIPILSSIWFKMTVSLGLLVLHDILNIKNNNDSNVHIMFE